MVTEEIERRRDDLVALATDLIGFDTISRDPDDPPREEADLQEYLARRLRSAGAETEVWEPTTEDMAGSRLVPPGLRFDGRPQMVARFPGQEVVASSSTATSMWSRRTPVKSGRATPSKPRYAGRPLRARRRRHEGRHSHHGHRRRGLGVSWLATRGRPPRL